MKRRAFLASTLLAGCGGGWGEASIALPSVLRSDLHYCYYMSLPGQMAATADHTSLLWHAQFYGLDALEDEVRGYPHRLVLDCSAQLMRPTGKDSRKALSPSAEADLRVFFADLRARGLLGRVAYLTPMDEPNLFANSEADLLGAVAILKRVAADYHELAGVRYVCIYGSSAVNLHGLHEFDIVGIDNYAQQSEVLTKGAHADLMEVIALHQQVMVIPGAAYYQDPAPFVAYAHSEPRCWGVVPFIWSHVPESADKEGWKGLQVQGPAEQQRYRSAGATVLNKRVHE
ncbi:hypothetical protein [Acidovorax sp. LjRoot117]|uniref:hypothetical protein n=1 Tax=Acidovorax sp. LjRoot117 TaxID=3342255 RepID=UPI003ECD4B7B